MSSITRGLAARRELLQQLRIAAQLGRTIDAQGLRGARDHEEHADVRVLDDVGEAVRELVARSVGDHDRGVVLDVHEAGRVTLR